MTQAESLEVLKSESTPINARPYSEKGHLDKDGKDQRDEKGYWGSKKKWIIREDNTSKVSVCYQ